MYMCLYNVPHYIVNLFACLSHTVLSASLDQQMAVKSKMAELRLKCQLLVSQVSNMKNAASTTSPNTEVTQLPPSPSPTFSQSSLPFSLHTEHTYTIIHVHVHA